MCASYCQRLWNLCFILLLGLLATTWCGTSGAAEPDTPKPVTSPPAKADRPDERPSDEELAKPAVEVPLLRSWTVASQLSSGHFAVSQDGSVVVCSFDVALGIQAFNTATGRRLWGQRSMPAPPNSMGTFDSLVFSPNGKYVFGSEPTNLMTPSVVIRDAKTGTVARVYRSPLEAGGPSSGFALSPDGRVLAISHGFTGGIALWDAHTGKSLGKLDTSPQMLLGMRFSPQADILAIVGLEMDVQAVPGGGIHGGMGGQSFVDLWDVNRRQLIHNIKLGEGMTSGHMFFEPPVFSPEGKLAAYSFQKPHVVDAAGKVKLGLKGTCLREAKTGKELATHALMGHRTLRFLDQGKTLLGVSYSPAQLQVQLCDVETGNPKTTLSTHMEFAPPLGGMAISPNGEVLAVTSPEHRINLWHVRTGRKLAVLKGPQKDFMMYSLSSIMTSLAPTSQPIKFSGDGRRLVSQAFFGDKPPVPGVIIGSQTKNAQIKLTVWDVEQFCGTQQQTDQTDHPDQEDEPPLSEGGKDTDASKPPPETGDETEPPPKTDSLKPRRMRTWTSADGQHEIRAELAGTDNGDAILKREDGRAIRVPLSKLSRADQAYVRVMSKREKEQ